MKYLKYFENKQEFYKRIDVDVLTDEIFNPVNNYKNYIGNGKPFTDKEISTIKSVIPNEILVSKGKGSHVLLLSGTIHIMRIFKLSDEWYYVDYDIQEEYYKCDQFDGLIQCLKDIEIEY